MPHLTAAAMPLIRFALPLALPGAAQRYRLAAAFSLIVTRLESYRRPLRSAMQPDRISLGPVHPRPYDLFPLARQREHVLAIDQLHQCCPVTCISRVVMRWASADVTVSNITVPI